MTIIEQRMMEIICNNLPSISSNLSRISNELKRIADSLEVVACDEIPSRISIGGKTFNVAYKPQTKKENEDDKATID